MKKINTLLWALVLGLCVIISSCSKEDTPIISPEITFTDMPESGYSVCLGQILDLTPTITNEKNSTFQWFEGEKLICTEKTYSFKKDKEGKYTLTLKVTNEGGGETISTIKIEVLPTNAPQIIFNTPESIFHTCINRNLLIKPAIINGENAKYEWTIDGEKIKETDSSLTFNKKVEGEYLVGLKIITPKGQHSASIKVTIYNSKNSYRPASSGKYAIWKKVYKFLPAPGQYVNEHYSAKTMEEAIKYAEERLIQNYYVSLGGFGGHIIIGFDHSVDNKDGNDIKIVGNSFNGSSEPGIVWVMQDENGDGLPNDNWYQLKGSEYEKPETIFNYSVTYYKPDSPREDTKWKDNIGNEGVIDYLSAYHKQAYYYPAWVKENSYTLTGTLLKSRTFRDHSKESDACPTYWVNDSFNWGYVDNYGSDRLDGKEDGNAATNGFDLSKAVDFKGNTINLEFIDFIKVQTGVNVKAGWLGENSTEVFGFEDIHFNK